jgi:D-alanyl-D-alanine carboxypeptidase/D-alanyl-D-alanine-endopeptidase (penicillin-binding protein 4)
VYGRGDPTFAPRFHNGDYATVLTRLVSALTNAGVRNISGDLVLDSSWFFGPAQGSSWLWDDLESGYGTATSALTVNDNVIDFIAQPAKKVGEAVTIQLLPPTALLRIENRAITISAGTKSDFNWRRPFDSAVLHLEGGLPMDVTMRPGSVSAPNPEALFGEQLRRELAAARITIHGRTRFIDYRTPATERPDYHKLQLLAASTSAPLSEILPLILKPSQNLYAETLFLTAGKAWQQQKGLTDSSGQLGTTTEQRAAAALRDFAKSLKLPESEFYLEEGSGLSRNNLITPYALVELLRSVKSKPYANALEAALPVAGVDGTLLNRFKGSLAQGNVRAKTGTLLYLSSLSGYCTTAAQEPLAFSFIINSYIPSDGRPTAPAIIDELVKLLCRYKGGSIDTR